MGITKLRWAEILFIICFLVIAVGGTWLWPSQSFIEAVAVLMAATFIAAAAWLAILFFAFKRRDRR